MAKFKMKDGNRMKVNLISLGCSKNLIDTETAAGLLGAAGFEFVTEPPEADVVVLNTCSFIKAARDESYSYIEKLSRLKKKGRLLVVCGCLPQMEADHILEKFPAVDAVAGSSDFRKITGIVKRIARGAKVSEIGNADFIYDSGMPRLISSGAYAYVKIAEGCSHNCAYCIIPSLRGKYRCRRASDIVREAVNLSGLGVKEIILTANDTASYISPSKRGERLPELLRKLDAVKGIERIRVLYLYPAHIDDGIIEAFASLKKIAPYFDMPVQHTDDAILRRMGRPSFARTLSLIEKIRKMVPGAVLRTTFITGFPGETRARFRKLLRDAAKIRFDWAGVFPYSDEKGARSSGFLGKVPAAVARRRAYELYDLQKKITFSKNRKYVGKKLKSLIDTPVAARAWFQAPGVDGKIILSKKHRPGKMRMIKITASRGWDLIGE